MFYDGDIPGLPTSPTGVSVVSLSQIARVKTDKLAIWQPDVIGRMPEDIVVSLLKAVENMPTLTKNERTWLSEALSILIN